MLVIFTLVTSQTILDKRGTFHVLIYFLFLVSFLGGCVVWELMMNHVS